jgi:hypothetical protein
MLVAAFLASCAEDAAQRLPAALRDPAVTGELHDRALVMATRALVPSPATMQAVAASDHQAAEAVISGAVIGDHAPVYVVQMTGGTFTAPNHPRGVAAPTGQFLTVTFDAATLDVTDIGYDDVPPDLRAIDGDVVDLTASAAAR